MVRIKNRWLLLSVSTCPQSQLQSQASSANPSPSCHLQPHPNLDSGSLTRLIRTALALNFGDAGAGALGGLICKYYAPATGTAIVRCTREGVQVVRATLFMIDEALGRKTRIVVEHCGGTIKKVQRRAIQLDRRQINRLFHQRKVLAHKASSNLPAPSLIAPTSALASLDSEDLGTSIDANTDQNASEIVLEHQRKRKGGGDLTKGTKKQKLDEEEEKILEKSRLEILSLKP